MKDVRLNLYHGGKSRVATFSYDDGVYQDLKLIEILNKYGLKGTFHLNGGSIGVGERKVKAEDIGGYKGHEISCHSLNHPFLQEMNRESVLYQVIEDRKVLEGLTGIPVNGMSYPYGTYNDEVIELLDACGIVYCRTTVHSSGYGIPENFLAWHPTTHHRHEDIFQLIENYNDYKRFGMLYIWGHSYEFDRNEKRNNWDHIEEVCKRVSRIDSCWFATNIEIYNYLTALKQMVFAVDNSSVINPTALDLWITVDSEPVMVPAGKTVSL